MKKLVIFGFLILWIFFMVTETFAEKLQDKTHVYAIQNKIYHCYHEIGLCLGYVSDDDFYHLYPLGLNYTYHFNEHVAWEVVRGYWVINQEKDLRENLKKIGAAPIEFHKTKYMLHSHLVIKPLYGKDALWNRRIVNHESYFFLGGGVVNYKNQVDHSSENVPSISFGLGIKYFLNEHLCLNIETCDMINFKEKDTENNLWFGLGLGFRFNLSPRTPDESSTIKSLNKYLGVNND